jgi:methylmalonyl-CoA/ethylmalonyl-CoA epimerase
MSKAGPAGVLGQVALHVSDPDRAEAFYRDKLGFAPLFRFGQTVFFDMAGVRLMLEGGHEPTGKRDEVCLYFRVESIDRAAGELSARGVYLERAPQMVARMPDHELWMCFFRDPDGTLLAYTEERR